MKTHKLYGVCTHSIHQIAGFLSEAGVSNTILGLHTGTTVSKGVPFQLVPTVAHYVRHREHFLAAGTAAIVFDTPIQCSSVGAHLLDVEKHAPSYRYSFRRLTAGDLILRLDQYGNVAQTVEPGVMPTMLQPVPGTLMPLVVTYLYSMSRPVRIAKALDVFIAWATSEGDTRALQKELRVAVGDDPALKKLLVGLHAFGDTLEATREIVKRVLLSKKPVPYRPLCEKAGANPHDVAFITRYAKSTTTKMSGIVPLTELYARKVVRYAGRKAEKLANKLGEEQ